LLQALQGIRPQQLQPPQQRPIRTIPLPNPNQGNRSVAQKQAINKILILADDHGVLASGAFPNHTVIGRLEAPFEDMRRLMAF
jgi:hypothetical protein